MKKAGSQKSQKDVIREHDTPPPVLIAEGSFTIETTARFGGATAAGQGRKRHHIDFGGPSVAHIKIVDGSGEMLYRNDNPGDAEIRVLISDNTEVKLGQSALGLYIDLDTGKDLGNPSAGHGKRTERYRPKKSGNELEFAAISIAENATETAPLLFRVRKNDLNSRLAEAKIMVWLE